MYDHQDSLNITIKLLVIALLLILCVVAINFYKMSKDGSHVSSEAKGDAHILLKEVTETAVEALEKRREKTN